MPFTRRQLMSLLLAIPGSAFAQANSKPEYRTIAPPLPPGEANRLEVLELFSHACPYCYALHPEITAWSARLPPGVAFVKIPVAFGRENWSILVRTWFALQREKNIRAIDDALFDAIHRQRIPLNTKDQIERWLKTQDVDMAAFSSAFSSFYVNTQVARSDALARTLRLSGVPAIAVGGRYLVSDHTPLEMLAITDRLIADLMRTTR